MTGTCTASNAAVAAATCRVNGHPTERLPNTLNISFQGVKASCVLGRMQHRVAASAASACHAEDSHSASDGGDGKAQPVYVSYVLVAMGVPVEWGAGTLRLTVGRFSTEAEIDEMFDIMEAGLEELSADLDD